MKIGKAFKTVQVKEPLRDTNSILAIHYMGMKLHRYSAFPMMKFGYV